MHAFGFSTGALAYGDFRRALDLLTSTTTSAVELSALRDYELETLMSAVASLDLSRYAYVSIHAPSKFSSLTERAAADLLRPCIDLGFPVVMHPDAIDDPGAWDGFGDLLCLENMDTRKNTGRTPRELKPWFARFPDSSFCLDLGHARQVDPSLGVANELIIEFGDRLRQIHLSEVSAGCKHEPLSVASVAAVQKLAHRIPDAAVILESVVDPSEIDRELEMARSALDPVTV
ncbi:MAG: hypothetical protein GY937_09540 [bacterium]|nr:hypothetical protein [bacterium]